jgi:hypothetical protein
MFLLENLHFFHRILSSAGAKLAITLLFRHVTDQIKKSMGYLHQKQLERCLKLSIYAKITQIMMQKQQTNKLQN